MRHELQMLCKSFQTIYQPIIWQPWNFHRKYECFIDAKIIRKVHTDRYEYFGWNTVEASTQPRIIV